MQTQKLHIAIFASGSGSTAESIYKAIRSGELSAEVSCLIVSKAEAGAIKRLGNLGLPESQIVVALPENFAGPQQYGEYLVSVCRDFGVQFIGQYGWMPITPEPVVRAYEGYMINQHPGPIDPGKLDFGGMGMYGMRVHCARLYFVRKTKRAYWTEAIAQRVSVNVDKGPIVYKKVIEILPDDTPESLQQRVLPTEHRVQIATLQDFCSGTVKELTRDEPVVHEDEVEVLKEAKRVARLLYPHG